MPYLTRSKRARYLPKQEARQPSGDQAFIHSPEWRKIRLLKLRLFPICEACAEKGEYIDCTSGAPIDHIISRNLGGSELHLKNLLTLCPNHHAIKSALEKNGLKIAGVGEPGHLIPAPGERERIIKILNKNNEDSNPKEG